MSSERTTDLPIGGDMPDAASMAKPLPPGPADAEHVDDDPARLSRAAIELFHLRDEVFRVNFERMMRIQEAHGNPQQGRPLYRALRAVYHPLMQSMNDILVERYPKWRADLNDEERAERQAAYDEIVRLIAEAHNFLQE